MIGRLADVTASQTASQTASDAASEEAVGTSYRGLFAQPVLRRLAVADVCARLPQGMVSITLLLVAAQHASMTVAGLVVAGYTLGQAATGPVRGRLPAGPASSPAVLRNPGGDTGWAVRRCVAGSPGTIMFEVAKPVSART